MIAQLNKQYIKTRPFFVVRRLISYALFEGRPLTTNGRWINPFVFSHFWLEKKLPQLKKVKKPIFILGTGRSGTTILGVLLSMHHDVGFLNEPKALWHSIFSYEDVIGSYSRNPARYRLLSEDATEEVKRSAHRLFGAYLFATHSARLVDKYPELIFRIPFVKAIFPDARFIFLVRNGWHTCHSIVSWSERNGITVNGEVHNWWGADARKWNMMLDQLVASDTAFSDIFDIVSKFSTHINMAAVEWVITMREGLRRMEQYPGSIHLVRYEDIVTNPRQALSEILRFCNLYDDEKTFSYAEQVISPVPPHPKIEIHPVLHHIFNETMGSMGY